MNKSVIILSVTFALLSVLFHFEAQGARPEWTDVNYEVTLPSLVDPRISDGIEIFAKDGTVIIRTPRKVQVKVFTILGQLVSQDILNPGTSELKIASRGIYIIKIGSLTQKIAI